MRGEGGGGPGSRECQPTEPPDCGYGPPKATVSCARPLSPAKTLDRQQLRVRKGTKWTLFRKTTSRGRYILLTPQAEDVYIPLIQKETIPEELFIKKIK